MFSRCPSEFIHCSTVSLAEECPAAIFSPQVRPLCLITVKQDEPSGRVCENNCETSCARISAACYKSPAKRNGGALTFARSILTKRNTSVEKFSAEQIPLFAVNIITIATTLNKNFFM